MEPAGPSFIDHITRWVNDSHLVSRTGAGLAAVGIGLATAVPPTAGVWGLAALLAVAGAAIRFWSAGVISKNRELATTGPYAYVRNPLYTGSLLVAVAFLMLNGNPWFVVPMVIGAVVLYYRTVASEEAVLREMFGEAFEHFRATVPAIIPWKGRCDTGGSEVTYSFERSLFNKEYNGALATLAMLIGFYLYAFWIPEGVFRWVGGVAVLIVLGVRGYRRVGNVRGTRVANTSRVGSDPTQTSEPDTIGDTGLDTYEVLSAIETIEDTGEIDEDEVSIAPPKPAVAGD